VGRIDRVLDQLATAQHRRAGRLTVLSLVVAGAMVPVVLDLGLNSSWTALLPEDKPSVADLEKIGGRVGGLSTLTVAIRSDDLDAMQRFARDLVPRLEDLRDEQPVRSVDWNIASYEDFVWEHRHLYADLEDLEEANESLEERLDWERNRANPFYVDLENEEPPDPREVIDRMKERAEEGRERLERYPGGFYVHPDHDLLALFLRTDLAGGDAAGGARLIAAVEREVDALDPASYSEDLEVEYAGDVVVAREEHDAIARELTLATSITIAGVLLAIVVFFRRLRSIGLLGTALIVPVATTFAFAELAVDELNTSTAFLGSIVIGNGINPNIMWLARYFEERREGVDVREALSATHRGTWTATITASLAAAIAYGSLTITDFRGFRDFGIIGGVGMVLCWLGAYLVLPSMAALVERIKPLRFQEGKKKTGVYGIAFSKIVHRVPKGILVVSTVLGVGAVFLVGKAIAEDPLEYNFRNLKSVREGSTRAQEINHRVNEIVGGSGTTNRIALVVDSREDVRALEETLEQQKEEGDPPYGRTVTIDDLLPGRQDDKLPVLADIRETMLELRRFADQEERAEIDEHIPPEEIDPVAISDLPEDVARPFTERDGTRGRILFVEKLERESVWDGRYLVKWANALRELRLPGGERPPAAGRAPVFADMLEVIWTDGPLAIGASFVATLCLVLVAFRRGKERLLTMLALLLGIGWMGGTMALLGMKLNFLNFVAFPITFGNGVDYGVNVMRRYSLETRTGGAEPVRSAIEETGGAVILCALTTIIGYTSLYVSANQALNSFGEAMAISEVTCVAAAVLTMPAWLLFLAHRRGRKR